MNTLRPPELDEIARLIRAWIDGSISQSEVGRFVAVAVRIVTRRLGGELYSVARSVGTSPESLAVSLITPLLGEPPGPHSQVGRSWRRKPPLDNPPSVVAWLESLVFVTAVRSLMRINPDRYRARARVRRRLRGAIQSSRILLGIPVDRLEYIRLRDSLELDINERQVSLEEVRLAISRSWHEDTSLTANVEAAIGFLSELPERCRLIPFALFLQAIYDRERELELDQLTHGLERPLPDPEFEMELARTIERALAAIDPILGRYLADRKITAQQSSWVRMGAAQYVLQRAAGQEPVQHECLAEFWPGLTREEYRRNQEIRERFEYVAKLVWKRFTELWKRDLGLR